MAASNAEALSLVRLVNPVNLFVPLFDLQVPFYPFALVYGYAEASYIPFVFM